jgi:hypothetical protein
VNWRKKTVVAFILLLLGVSLVALPDGLARYINVVFSELNCGISYEELNEFMTDYFEYQMRLTQWSRYSAPSGVCCNGAIVIYNTTTIDECILLSMLMDDPRVNRAYVSVRGLARARQLAVRLTDNTCESEFLSRYEWVGLRANGVAWNHRPYDIQAKYFYFNDSIIYAGDLIDILRADDSVMFAYFVFGWLYGRYSITFSRNLNDYELNAFLDDHHLTEAIPRWSTFVATVDFILHDELYMQSRLQMDDRVSWANLSSLSLIDDWICREPQPGDGTSISSEVSIVPPKLISAYPNPVRHDDVHFKYVSKKQGSANSSAPEISIFNVRGQLIKRAQFVEHFVWDRKSHSGVSVPSGIYFYRVVSDDITQTGKILILN